MVFSRKPLTGLVVLILTLALALGGVVSPANAAITPEDDCVGLGGTWIGDGGSSETGSCWIEDAGIFCYMFGYAYIVGFFDGDLDAFGLGCAHTLGGAVDILDFDSLAFLCILEGGTWAGVDFENGTCTFPAGHAIALDDCGPGFASVYTIVDDEIVGDPVCVAGSSGGSSGGAVYPPYGRFGNVVQGEAGAGSLSLGGPKNGSVSFDAGTCAGKCTVSPNLPGGAKASLPDDATDTLYFRSTDADGEPGTGSYTVCFAVGELTSPVIYRYVGGAWVAQAVTISGGQVCTSGSGDGAYALGGS